VHSRRTQEHLQGEGEASRKSVNNPRKIFWRTSIYIICNKQRTVTCPKIALKISKYQKGWLKY
jgi:hypothetical protein